MGIRPWRDIERRTSAPIHVGDVRVGGDAHVSVQTMTNTPTTDVRATVSQVRRCAEAGADIIRVSCPDEASTRALAKIVAESPIPIVADIHFHYRRAIEAAEAGAACLRINPGNIGSKERIREVIRAARDHDCSMRIGVNGGSLERDLLEKYREPCPEALVESALRHADLLEENDFTEFKISVKASDPMLALASYRGLASRTQRPLHLGITEAGARRPGTVKSAFGIGMLLFEGIGDTLRVSLSDEPEEEVRVGFEILKALGIRHRGVTIVACPSCARQGIDVIRTVAILEERLAHIRAPVTLSLIGCVVNGPGEARETDVGFTGGGAESGMVYIRGVPELKTHNDAVVDRLVDLVEERAAEIEAARAQDRSEPDAVP